MFLDKKRETTEGEIKRGDLYVSFADKMLYLVILLLAGIVFKSESSYEQILAIMVVTVGVSCYGLWLQSKGLEIIDQAVKAEMQYEDGDLTELIAVEVQPGEYLEAVVDRLIHTAKEEGECYAIFNDQKIRVSAL